MRFMTPTDKQRRDYDAWVASRPDKVKEVCQRFNPWTLYRMTSTGHRVTFLGCDENGADPVTVRVRVSGRHNLILIEREVFGVAPEDLVECDLPQP